uniref:hypothetical protein n=1 Tax=Streptococcus acidominimus TaxID=1326 RepID=UPI001F59A043
SFFYILDYWAITAKPVFNIPRYWAITLDKLHAREDSSGIVALSKRRRSCKQLKLEQLWLFFTEYPSKFDTPDKLNIDSPIV